MPQKEPQRGAVFPLKPSVWRRHPIQGAIRAVGVSLAAALFGGLLFVFVGVSMALLPGLPRTSWQITVGTSAPGASVALALPPSLDEDDVPVAVIVENQVAARPAAGLNQARLVIEVPAEGGITRYLAVFSLADLPPRIGPVRSARPYLVLWAEEWQAPLFHSGGSPAALTRLRDSRLPNVDEISAFGRYFWRDQERLRPHNLYTSGRLIRQAFDDLTLPRRALFTPLPAAELTDKGVATPMPGVLITADDPDYCVAYRYDPAALAYERWLAGERHRTEDGTAVYAKSVLIPLISARVLDREGRLQLALDGSGQLTALILGRVIAGRWERTDGRTRYVDAAGEDLVFPDGPVWISVVTDAAAVQTRAQPKAGDDPSLGCE